MEYTVLQNLDVTVTEYAIIYHHQVVLLSLKPGLSGCSDE
jgi:hypothetical protein